ncbi:MAG: AraC family transcriptional regulator [Clostridiales bacterium]|nr:AraC family transcriptional regulator [Clostridiales bacterium]
MSLFYEVLKSDFSVIHNKKQLGFKEHMHKYVEILYVFSGTQYITVEGRPYAVRQGEAAVVFPDTAHAYFKKPGNSADELILVFDPAYLLTLFPLADSAYTKTPVIPKKRIDAETVYALETIDKNMPVEKKLGYLLIIFSDLYGKTEITRRTRIPIKNLAEKIINYIDTNYSEPITRESLAKEFNVSKVYITKIFSEKIKINLRTYLGQIRCRKAAELLRTTDFTVTAIGSLSGFESERTFTRVFKENFGMSPGAYRKEIRSE